MTSPDDTEWRKAYEASIERQARADEAARQQDPGQRGLELSSGLRVGTALLLFALLGIGLAVTGPWYVSVIGVMLSAGAVLAAAGAVVGWLRKS